MQPLLDFLGDRNDLRLIGPREAERRAPTVAVDIAGRAARMWRARWRRIGSWRGAAIFYAQRPLEAMGIDPEKGVLRMSFVHYTTAEEVGRLIGALEEVL